MEEFISENEEQTIGFGQKFAEKLQPGDVICLIGELGAGKTTFVKGLAKGLGIEARIISPTYVVVREHTLKSGIKNQVSKIDKLYHLDLYRLTSEKDVLGIDIHDVMKDKNAVTVIEWPEVALSLIPTHAWKIVFEHASEHSRAIKIYKQS
jgi:tRNA threonylcarbamoyladenosine biosynthesis protein TsaE